MAAKRELKCQWVNSVYFTEKPNRFSVKCFKIQDGEKLLLGEFELDLK